MQSQKRGGDKVNDSELLKLIIKKGVAVGMIQLLHSQNAGGVKEYNDYIGGDPALLLTPGEYDAILNKIKELC